MDIAFLFPFILLIGVMFLMTRSAKNRQRQASQLRDSMEPGSGVRTIGGMYAEVKEVRDDTVLLEVAPGVHAVYAKNAIGAVLDADEYERIINGDTHSDDAEDDEDTVVPDDASSLTEGDGDRVELGKPDAVDGDRQEPQDTTDEDGRKGSQS
ncbi:preprotein translocase subunit YajC [Streptomyces sp. SBT349]|uniref:preprotein translocase subunit YajC n=1 Tax=Streptomyces sp. SBT349 TaxID=1580539 RepID=UPI00066E9F43|nr:preprotein translocase subunit YajC [Streptomyces sp. SBT349]